MCMLYKTTYTLFEVVLERHSVIPFVSHFAVLVTFPYIINYYRFVMATDLRNYFLGIIRPDFKT